MKIHNKSIQDAHIVVVSVSPSHSFCKNTSAEITLLTGLRNPCTQLGHFQAGLMSAVLDKKPGGTLIRKAGVMAVVCAGGSVSPGDVVIVKLPPAPHRALERV